MQPKEFFLYTLGIILFLFLGLILVTQGLSETCGPRVPPVITRTEDVKLNILGYSLKLGK